MSLQKSPSAHTTARFASQPLPHPTPLPVLTWSVGVIDASVRAGFPSPAEDHMVKRIDLMEQLIQHPQATFMLRIRGESMRDAGIFDGDVVLVDRAITPGHGQVVVAVIDGEFVCKTLYQRAGRIKLKAANVTFADIVPKEGQTLEIWGVVIAAIKQFRT